MNLRSILLISTLVACLFDFTACDCVCGVLSGESRIVGGKVTNGNQYPWLAYLKIRQGTKSFSCVGALISDQYVLTAAHCLEGDVTAVRVFFNGFKRADFINFLIAPYHGEEFIIHEEYTKIPETTNDIALIKLREKIVFSKTLFPLCLPQLDDKNILSNLMQLNFTVAGWGREASDGKPSEYLKEAIVPYVPFRQCNALYDNKLNKDKHVCAGKFGEDTCQGDSGGPVMFKHNGRAYAIGVVSFGKGCGNIYPGVNTKVVAYLKWIKEKTEGSKFCS